MWGAMPFPKHMKYSLLAVICWVAGSHVLFAQNDMTPSEKLLFYSDVMVNASESSHRVFAQDQFNVLITETLSEAGSLDLDLDSLRWVKHLYSSDSTLRVITWELRISEADYKYFGFVQRIDSDGAYQLIRLDHRRRLKSEYAAFDNNTWYGALYYGMMDYTAANGERQYLLLGFNAKDDKDNFKVADVMTLTNNGVQFSSEAFASAEDAKSRIVIEYSDAAVGRMQFDRERNQLVYDNIVVINAGPEGPIFVPDGSYRGYELQNGQWVYVDKVFTEVVDEPPGEGLQGDGVDRDIIGRKQNKNNQN